MYYKNSDYTIRMMVLDGCEKYFIKFHSQSDTQELEISFEMFTLYSKEFNKPLERQRNERRRHIEDGEIDDLATTGKLTLATHEQGWAERADLKVVLKTCTPTQQKRVELHYIQGYTLEEIAKLQNCSKQSVSRSIEYVRKKIKKYFS